MFAYLKALASQLRRAWFNSLPPLPEDPYSTVREPRKRAPAGRGSAVAVEEPVEPSLVHADSARRNSART